MTKGGHCHTIYDSHRLIALGSCEWGHVLLINPLNGKCIRRPHLLCCNLCDFRHNHSCELRTLVLRLMNIPCYVKLSMLSYFYRIVFIFSIHEVEIAKTASDKQSFRGVNIEALPGNLMPLYTFVPPSSSIFGRFRKILGSGETLVYPSYTCCKKSRTRKKNIV